MLVATVISIYASVFKQEAMLLMMMLMVCKDFLVAKL